MSDPKDPSATSPQGDGERANADSFELSQTKRYTSAPEIGAMLDRVCRALVRRATDGDLEALEELANLERRVTTHLRAAAQGAHDGRAAYSWTEIGATLGTSRQSARRRFAPVKR